jgi:hypothetical protein
MVTSCSDNFLNVTPKSSLTSANFFKSNAQFNQAINGAYAPLRTVFAGQSSWAMGDMRSDNTFYTLNSGNRGIGYLNIEFTDEFLDDPTSQLISEQWNTNYIGIARTNKILSKLSSSNFLTQKQKKSYAGQAKFIRALLYFQLVRYFGGAPLDTIAVNNAKEAYQKRSSVDDVYSLIINDAKDAINDLQPPSGFPQSGRATQGSARMLLADVYLTRKKYKLAKKQLSAIMKMGYGLLPKYASVFDLAHENSRESIFSVQFKAGQSGQNSNIPYPWMPLTPDASLITGITSTIKYGGWNEPTQEMIDTYEKGDKRLPASISIIQGLGPIDKMTVQAIKSPIGYTTPPGKVSYRFSGKKFLTPSSLQYNTGVNWPVYRYSEALLDMAEVLTDIGKSSEALPYLNKVRARAGLSAITETDKSKLLKIIWHEERVELAFENKRWFQLLRTGRAIKVMTKEGKYLKSKHSFLPANSYDVTRNKLLFPIPHREVEIGGLQQNPGY